MHCSHCIQTRTLLEDKKEGKKKKFTTIGTHYFQDKFQGGEIKFLITEGLLL